MRNYGLAVFEASQTDTNRIPVGSQRAKPLEYLLRRRKKSGSGYSRALRRSRVWGWLRVAFANDFDAFDVQGVDQKRHLVLFALAVEDFDGEVAGLVAADPRGKELIRLRRVHPIGERVTMLAEHSEARGR